MDRRRAALQQRRYRQIRQQTVLSGPTIPRAGLKWYVRAPGMADIIGLSVSDYASVPAELQSIFFIDETHIRPTADAYALARVSEYLNTGEMVGRGEGKGIALYADGTDEVILTKACRYFRVTFGEQYYDTDLDGKSVFGTPDIGGYEWQG